MAGDRNAAVFSKLEEYISTDKKYMYFLLYKFYKPLIPKKVEKFSDLHKQFPKVFKEDLTEEDCEKWLLREDMQKAAKYLLKTMETKREIELLNSFYEQAMTTSNPKSLDCYLKMKETLFNEEEKVDELANILNNFSLAENSKEVELEMRL